LKIYAIMLMIIGKLVELEEQSRRSVKQSYLRQAADAKRHLNEYPSNEEHDFRFYLINVGGTIVSVGLVHINLPSLDASSITFLNSEPSGCNNKLDR
jgi:hypothetical protein